MVEESPKSGELSSTTDWWKVLSAPLEPPSLPKETSVDRSKVEDEPPPTRETADVIERETANDMVANRELREKYAFKAHSLACACLWWWGGMLVASGFVNGIQGRELWSDKVIMAVTTGVTVSVLAAFLGVIRGLFPHAEKKK